jgi:hypothetical protein
VTDTQLPGVFGDVQPLLEHYGYLGVGGMLFLEDFGVPVPGEITLIAAAVFAGAGQMNIAVVFLVAVLAAVIGDNIVEIYDTFERYKWYVIGALAVVVAIVITRRVRRGRAERTA